MARKKQTTIDRNARVRQWLKEHDLLNIARVCRRMPYSRGTFAHFEEGHQDLSEEATTKLETILKQYGYKG